MIDLHLTELMHNASQALLYPTQILLVIFIIFAVCLLAALCVEGFVERRHFKADLPKLLADINAAPYAQLSDVIEGSGLLRKQKTALQTLVAYGYLPQEGRIALAKRILAEQESQYVKSTSRTDLIAKISPMVGLMGTLIPLGPGVVAMGQGQVDVLSESIEIAFDTTIAGLVVAAISLFVNRFRKRWYEDYLGALEAAASAILEKAQRCVESGENLGDAESAAAVVALIEAQGSFKGRKARTVAKTPVEENPDPSDAAFTAGVSSEGE